MKTCPTCGKSVPDYATHCKYCDNPIPAFQPALGSGSIAVPSHAIEPAPNLPNVR